MVDPKAALDLADMALSATSIAMDIRGRRERDFYDELMADPDLSAETILELMQVQDLFAEIVERGLEGARKSSSEKKRRLLGRVVASALDGSGFATPDRYLLLVRTIEAIEPVHVQVLVLLATPVAQHGEYARSSMEGWSSNSDLLRRRAEIGDVLEPVLAVLVREGLAQDMTTSTGDRVHAPTLHGRFLLHHLIEGDLEGSDLGAAALVARIDEHIRFEIVIRNIGPARATGIRISVPPQKGEEIILQEGKEMMGFDLDAFQEFGIPTRIPTLAIGPPFSVRVTWSDDRGNQLTVIDVDRNRD